jgi:hypothetical protein
MNTIGTMVLLLSLITLGSGPVRANSARTHGRWHIAGYDVIVEERREDDLRNDVLRVYRGKQLVYEMTDSALRVNPRECFPDESSREGCRPGTDILGIGEPVVVVEGFSGGGHCCSAITILILGTIFKALPPVEALDGEPVFRRHPGQSSLVLEVPDATYAYWHAPFALSALPLVRLRFDPKAERYIADPELMRSPLPSRQRLTRCVQKARAEHIKNIRAGSPDIPSDLSGPIFDLIYTGHLPEARAFLVEAWAGPAKQRDEYWSELTSCKLRQSQFWPCIAKMNDLKPDLPVPACPESKASAEGHKGL